MKNVILIDRGIELVDDILNETDYVIEIIIVSTEVERNLLLQKKSNRINKIYTVREVQEIDILEDFDYKLILDYRETQLKVENGLNRFTQDYQIRKKIYYMALVFWSNIFKKNKIDAVIIKGVNLGQCYDCIPHDMGIKNNIPTYIFEATLNNTQGLYDNLNNEFVRLEVRKNIISMDDCKFYNRNIDKNFKENVNRETIFTKYIKKILYCIGGALMLEFINCLKRQSFNKVIGDSAINVSYFHKLSSHINSKIIKRYMDNISVEYSRKENYIFYALHFEPEASIQCRHVLENQLIVVKMIAESLPIGWKLYVKEHPYQYEINTMETE